MGREEEYPSFKLRLELGGWVAESLLFSVACEIYLDQERDSTHTLPIANCTHGFCNEVNRRRHVKLMSIDNRQLFDFAVLTCAPTLLG